MLADSDEDVCRIAVNKIMSLHRKLPSFNIPNSFNDNGYFEQNDEDDVLEDEENASNSDHVRKFKVPVINLKAKVYYNLINLNNPDIEQPPAIRAMTDEMINDICMTPLSLKHPCHNQKFEWHVKLVSEASLSVARQDRSDGMIRQRIRSLKLMKNLDNKRHFNA